jgi:hypothetical protein
MAILVNNRRISIMKNSLNIPQRIKFYYENARGDSTELFREILRVSDEIGLDEALAILEQCVIERRLAWAHVHLAEAKMTGQPVLEGY